MSGHVVLVGMMGSGKTSVGQRVANELGRPFLDSDAVIEERTGMTVREVFERDGEEAFRRHEAAALADALADPEPSVIAAAGGVVLDPANRALLTGDDVTVVWLDAPPAVLAQRVESGDHRPLLGDDPAAALDRLDTERRPLYREVADTVVDVSTCDVDEAVAVVLGVASPA